MSNARYDVILVDVEPNCKSKLREVLMKPPPYPNLTREVSGLVLVRRPAVVVPCVNIQEAVFLELLIELAGGTVMIRPSKKCSG